MAHRHLLVRCLLQHKQGRQEAMHAREERHALGILRVHHLQRTARVHCCVARHHAAPSIGNLRLHALEPRVLAVCTDAHYHIILINILQKQIKILGSRLQVGIDITNQSTFGVVDASLDGSTQSAVFRQRDIEHVRLTCAHLPNALQTFVLRSVIYKKHT